MTQYNRIISEYRPMQRLVRERGKREKKKTKERNEVIQNGHLAGN